MQRTVGFRRFSILICLICLSCLTLRAQEVDNVFKRTIYNSDYNVYITMNFYDKDVLIPGQEFMGELDGYLGDYDDFRKWLILGTSLTSDTSADMSLINTEGSEDLRATLTYNANGTYTLRQGSGSTLKIARKQKWVKLPKSLTFTTTREEKK